MITVDRLDVRLLEVLTRDGRAGVGEIASELGIARNTVQSRLRRLEEAGVMTGFRPALDLAQAGITTQAFIGLEVQQGRLARIVAALARIPYVLEVHATTGREDLLIRVATVSQADLQDLIERIVAIDGVVHSTTTLALTTPLAYRAMPLLNEITRGAGWGRSTPSINADGQHV
ncbi:Lrp/AsnC family transcriptional regulator [Mycobacterium avium]|uniref:Lrp/AsnC family transcriptional regulator n=1 Tax=Mycobacterium avium TaxID=1764 RepID=UPI001CC46DA6|nr:Lrp/AsnC family transcriptional regulator [Mycobacterium avium]MBZ4521866.1 Lrp/AsnC family transcriptional regulator [Mycobacterium avium subsp. hominissuis]MBZ4531249.1 Lrp/AsnC family transcriptional regulator [Mycobacterium avium subsp. hominissuis]